MRWRRVSDSPDVIDQRGGGSGFRVPGGARVGVPGGLGLAGLVIVLLFQLLGGGGSGTAFDVDSRFGDQVQAPGGSAIPASQDPERDLKDFSVYVFTNAQQMWAQTFRDQGTPYERAKLVLYRGGVSTGCGDATSAVGPFYCPADQRVYLDLSFYDDMSSQLGATGDFAWAYVIAHEMGHHVQQQLGTSDRVRALQRQSAEDVNELSVRLELQADCYAGIWAQSVFEAGDLEPGDVGEGLRAAEAVGDDRLQRRASGSIDPDSFTHGTSEQRARWFENGRSSGEPAACDTFSSDEL
jgi:hypothetical protein